MDRESPSYTEPEPDFADTVPGICAICFALCVIAWAALKWITS